MPKTKAENVFFTLITSGLMIFLMGVYNAALHGGGLKYSSFVSAARTFPLEWIAGFIFAFFIAPKTARYFAFKVAKESDREIFKILCIQTFTVLTMVPLMSLVGTIEMSGVTVNILTVWLQTVAINFIAAYPLQIFAVGPLCRTVFRIAFRKSR
ncbi:MAG: DUF2798 domain-containing protein [Clostridia bacterium]